MPKSATHESAPSVVPHVLVVDDDTRHLAAVRRVLKRSGFEVTLAVGGAQALKIAKGAMPDLIVLDASMPKMSGQEFIRCFRKLEAALAEQEGDAAGPTPVVFLSGCGGLQQRISGLDAGAVDYLVKPCNPDELRARVRSHLRCARLWSDDAA